MANVFSTATLGLRVDTDKFNKSMRTTGAVADTVLTQMRLGADAFGAEWQEATRGIKDTKRIISGILISQGFYTLMNGLAYGASEALTFARNMETAGVSMEYFVEGADKAAKSLAYLREINEFAARTPFSTEEALEMSKYMQAVGVGMNYTKSFLQVVTDAAAATGATEETLQRVVFALGQMKTKGRIANEEIRQLANANIPIYEILQEELNLTGEQISNIGNYWIDADKAIVAILDGLSKRYDGAADRISDTVTGMLDTLADNSKIIVQQASAGIYDSLSEGLTVARDKLDDYREVVTQFGSAGLFNQILLDIDPSGEFGTQLLTLMGNTRQLGAALLDLYNAAKPLLNLFGRGLYAGINTVQIGVTAFSRAVEGLIAKLNSLGITTGTTAEFLSRLYITYTASKWMFTLGQGALYAGMGLMQTVTSLTNILPASMVAQTGIMRVVATLGVLAAAVAGISMLLGSLNDFAGLEVDTGSAMPTDYETAMDEYLRKMEEYNAAIAKYQEAFNQPYAEMTDGAADAVTGIEEVEDASKKAAAAVKRDWTAAFDETYSIPDQSSSSSGGTDDLPAMPDLGELLSALKFKFPSVGETELKMPEFPWEDVFSGGLLDNTTLNQDWWKKWLPGIITTAVLGGATAWSKEAKKRDVNADGGRGKTGKADTVDPKKAAAELEKLRVEQTDLLKKLNDSTEQINKKLNGSQDKLYGPEGRPTVGLEGSVGQSKLILKELKEVQSGMRGIGAAIGKDVTDIADTARLEASINQGQVFLNNKRITEIKEAIETNGQLTQAEIKNLRDEQARLAKENLKYGVTRRGTDVSSMTTVQLQEMLGRQSKDIINGFKDTTALGAPRSIGALDSGRYLTAGQMTALLDNVDEFLEIGARIEEMLPTWATASTTEAARLYNLLSSQKGQLDSIRKAMVSGNKGGLEAAERFLRAIKDADTSATTGISNLDQHISKLVAPLDKATTELRGITELVESISDESVAIAANTRELQAQARAEAARRQAHEAAQAQLQREMLAMQKKATADAAAARTSYMPDNRVIRGVFDSLGIARPTEAAALPTDARAEISSEVKNIKQSLKAIETASISDLLTIKANLQSIDESIGVIKLNGGTLNKGLSKASASFAAQFGVEMPNLLGPIQKTQLNILDALQSGFAGALPSSGLTNYGQAVSGVSVPKALEMLSKEVKGVRNALLSGSKLSGAVTGVGAFEGTALDTAIAAFGKAYPEIGAMGARDASFVNEIKKALGKYLEPLVSYTAGQQFKAIGGEVGQGGFKSIYDGVVQIDTTLKLNGRLLSNDIKTVGSDAVAMYELMSKEYMGGVRKLSADVLKAVRPASYYELGMQSVAMDPTAGAHTVGMSVFNRDFDVRELDGIFDRFQQNMQTFVKDGRMFSSDAVLQYARVSSKNLDNAAALVDNYMRNVVLPTLGIPVDAFEEAANGALQSFADTMRMARLDAVAAATQPYLVEYKSSAISGLDVKGNTAAAKQINSMLAAVMDNDNIADFLHSYIVFNDAAGELAGTVAAIDMNSTLRQYVSLRNSANKWTQNILKTGESFNAGAITPQLTGAIDTLVNNYIYDIARTSGTEAKSLTDSTSKALKQIAEQARAHASGATTELFAGVSTSYDDMSLLARSLETLADNLEDTNKTASLLRSVVDRVDRANSFIKAKMPVGKEVLSLFDGLGREVEQLFKLLGVSANEATIGLVRRIERFSTIAKQLSGPAHYDELFGSLSLPFEVAPIKDTAAYMARELSDAARNGLIKIGDKMTTQFEADVSALLPQTEGVSIKFVGDLAQKTLEIPAKVNFVDFEALDLMLSGYSDRPITPPISQMSFYGATEDKVYTWLVDYGARNDDIVKRMASIQGLQEAWKDMSHTDAVSMQQLTREFMAAVERNPGPISGYNAVNVLHMGGGYDANLLESMGVNLVSKYTTDVMTEVKDLISRYTGTEPSMNLREAYQIATGGSTEGAHLADFDVLMTKAVHDAITDGSFEEVVKSAAATGFEGGIKNSLQAASNVLITPKALSDTTERVVSAIGNLPARLADVSANPIQDIFDAAADFYARNPAIDASAAGVVSNATGEAAENVAKRAAAGGPDIWNIFKRFFSEARSSVSSVFDGTGFKGLSDELKANFKTFFERWSNPASSYAAAAEGFDVNKLYDLFDELAKQNTEYMSAARGRKFVAEQAINTGAATADTPWVKEAFEEYDKALKQYSEVSNTFYKTVTEQVAGGLQGFENDGSIMHAIQDLGRDTKALAFTLDPKTGQMKLVRNALLSSGDDITAAMLEYSVEFMKQSGVVTGDIDSALKEVVKALNTGDASSLSKDAKTIYDAFTEISKAAHVGDFSDLSKAGSALYEGVSSFGKNTVIFDMADDITEAGTRLRYAGTGAAQTIDAAAGTVAGSFKNVGSRLLNGIAGFGVLDVAAAAIEGTLQHFSDINAGQYLQSIMENSIDTERIAKELSSSGFNIGEAVGSEVYHGAAQAIGHGVITGVVGSLAATAGAKVGAAIGTAIAPGLGTAVGAVLGTVVGTITGLASDLVIRSTGGKSDTNLYLDDYLKALQDGQILTNEMLAQAEEALGRALTVEETAALEKTARQQLTYQTMGDASYGWWERDDVNKVLYGQDTRAKLAENSVNDTDLALRIAQAVGAVNTDALGKYTTYDETGNTASTILTVKDPAVIKELQELLGVNLELKEIAGAPKGTMGLYDADNGRFLEGNDTNLEALREALSLMYEQGNSTSAIASKLGEVLESNDALKSAVAESVGRAAQAVYEDLDGYLAMYNEQTGTHYTRETLDDTPGLGAALMEQAIKTFEAINSTYLAEAEVRKGDTWNRSVTEGDTSSTIWGASLSGTTQETLDELAKFGIKLSEASTIIDTELTGAISQSYVTLQTSAEDIKKNLAGWSVDTTGLTGIDFGNLTLSTEDVEILASAGIQINGDGSVTFMKALNADSTGAERGMSLSSESFAQGILDTLSANKIGIDFEAKSLNIDTSVLEQSMSGAMFKLPDNWDSYASKQVKTALENIGDLMDSGYFMLTDTSLLQGDATIQSYLEGMVGASNISEKVSTAIGNIDSLIQQEGANAAANIVEWADGIVMPSVIPKEQMTAEIEAAFNEVGISFTEYAGQYMMIVNQAGEHLYDGVTTLDKEKWYGLDESLRIALEELGVTVTDVGNQVMVDLSGTFDNGISDVVDLFIEQPEVWNQIPETVKQYLAEAGVMSEEGFLVLKNIGDGKLTELSKGWVTMWETLTDDTLKEQIECTDGTVTNLEDLKSKVDDGLLKIAGVVDASTIPELTENQIAVPFEKLPAEIREALQGQDGLKGTLEGSNVILENATREAFIGFLGELESTKTSASGTATDMATAIETAVTNAMNNIRQLESLQSQMGKSGGFLGIGSKQNYAGNPVTIGGTTYLPEMSGTTGEIIKYWYTDEAGKRYTTTTLPKKASGGMAGGVTLTGELGREMAILPDGTIKMLGANGRGELVNLPDGTRVLNNDDTEQVLKYAGPIKSLDKLAAGNATVELPGVDEDADFKATFMAFMRVIMARSSVEAQTETTDLTVTDDPVLVSIDTAANHVAENIQVAVRGAVTSLIEHSDSRDAELLSFFDARFEALNSKCDSGVERLVGTISEAANMLNGTVGEAANLLNNAIYDAADAIAGVVGSLRSQLDMAQSMLADAQRAAAASSGSSSGSSTSDSGYDWLAEINAAKKDYAEATTDAQRTAAHERAEAARATQGYSGGADGSQYIPLKETSSSMKDTSSNLAKSAASLSAVAGLMAANVASGTGLVLGSATMLAGQKSTIKANARGGLIESDTLIRAGEFGKSEAVVPLEQPSVMEQVGATIGAYVQPVDNAAQEVAIQEAVQTLLEGWNVAIRGAVATITENEANHSSSLLSNIDLIISTVDENLQKLDALDNLGNAVSNLSSSIQAVQSAVSDVNNSLSTTNAELEAVATTEAVEQLPAGMTAEFGQWFTASLAAAREAYATATTDEERNEAHLMAEDVRRLSGYSGGPDGSQYIPLTGTGAEAVTEELLTGLVNTLHEAIVAHQASEEVLLQSIDKNNTAAVELFKALLSEQFNRWLADYSATSAAIISAIDAGCSSVASAVGSYVDWSQSTINTLREQVSSLQAAASRSARSTSSIKGSAKGSLVTKDALYRAGEGGLNEAIVPLEQPSVMAQVGATIADYIPTATPTVVMGSTTDLSGLLAKLDEKTEVIALAIRGAVAAITENEANHTDGLLTNIDAINATVADNLGKLDALDNLTNGVSNLSSSIGSISGALSGISSAVSGIPSAITSTTSAVSDITPTITEAINTNFAALGLSVDEMPPAIGAELAIAMNAQIAAARADYASATTDEERAEAHNKAEDARRALGYSGGADGSQVIPLNGSDNEAILEAFAQQNSVVLEAHELQNTILTEALEVQSNVLREVHAALLAELKLDTEVLKSELVTYRTSFDMFNTSLTALLLSNKGEIIGQINMTGITVANAVGSYVDWSQNTISSLQSQVRSLQSALAFASSSKSSKGSASGSLVTKDALYRAGELGLNEAIIPLERPDVLQQVGSAIASFMPVEKRSALSAVAGMQNAGVQVIQQNPVQQQQDMMYMADALTQRVLEAVLPQMSYSEQDGEDRRPLYVGTLIADEAGLKTLERKLYDIRQIEATRRN